ncbi:MAG: ISAs1 family transposase [Treponema sp.]|nr:ISAs1 family transposase [Treponema sp.]
MIAFAKGWEDIEVIAIDGKTLRGSFNTRQGTIHLVSARATENRLVFAQVKTEEKSNEITAIPAVLAMTALTGCIATINAMGCQ